MHVEFYGPETGKPVLLLHGGGVAGWMWDSLRDALVDDYRVIVPDLPGHGASSEPYFSHDHVVTELAQLCDPPTAVIGFSLGAQLAVLLAASHREKVRSVGIISAQARPLPLADLTVGMVALSAPLAKRRWFARTQARALFIPAEHLEDYLETSAAISRETLITTVRENISFTIPEGWADFPGQALIMVGAKERRLMRDSASDLHRAISLHRARPRSELEVVPECGHGIPLQNPHWFNERVREII